MTTTLMNKILIASLLISLCALAQPTPDPRIGSILGELASVRPFDRVAISPDGKRVAWIEEIIENRKDTGNSAIYIMELHGGARRCVSARRDRPPTANLAWSPDSSSVAFLSDREKKGQMQLYVAPATGGPRAEADQASPAISPIRAGRPTARTSRFFSPKTRPAAEDRSKPSRSKRASSEARSTTSA